MKNFLLYDKGLDTEQWICANSLIDAKKTYRMQLNGIESANSSSIICIEEEEEA